MAATTIDEQLTIVIKAQADQAKQVFTEIKEKLQEVQSGTDKAAAGTKKFSSASKDASQSVKVQSSSIADMVLKYVSLTAAVSSVVAVTRQAISDAEAERKGLIRLQSVIESTGRSGEITAGQIDEMTQSLEDFANQDKQAAMDAVAQIATYDEISSDLFGRILTASSNIAAAFNNDISSAVSNMGRVLQDPLTGMTRLQRQGIMISSEIQDQVKSLIEQNRLYDAQVLLLDEIDEKVGGVAEKMAEVATGERLATMWGKFVGELGNTIAGGTTGVQGSLADLLNNATSYMEYRNLIRSVSDLDASSALSLGTADMSDLVSKMRQVMAMQETGLGVQEDMILHQTQSAILESNLIPILEDELEKRQQVSDAEAEALEIEKRRKKEQEERLSLLESEKEKTDKLSALYAATDEGQVWSLENQIDELDQMWRSDMLSLSRAMNAGDDELVKIINERIAMYGAIREDLAMQLSDLTEPSSDGNDTDEKEAELEKLRALAETEINKLLSDREAKTFELVHYQEELNKLLDEEMITQKQYNAMLDEKEISLGFALDADKERLKLLSDEEKAQSELEEYQRQLNDLLEDKKINQEEYNRLLEIEKDTLGLNNDEKEKAEELEKLTAQAEEEKLKLLSDEEKSRRQSIEYQQLLNTLFEAGLISQDEFNQLLSRQNELLGLSGDEISSWQTSMQAVKSEWDSFLQNSLSYRTVAGQISSALSAVGEAWASNEDAGAAALQSFEQFSRQIINEMTNMLITAGLRCIIEGNIPVGLALLAAGGMTGIMGGALFGSSRAVSDSMMSMMENQIASMEREAEAREKLVNAINDSIDTEFELLRRQLDRNLISEDEFIAGAGELQNEREEAQHTLDVANARTAMANAIYSKIAALDTEYSQMSGWDKFWSGRDNDIKDEINDLESYLNKIQGATEDELRNILDALVRMGVSTSGVPAFAEGGEFFTRGAQLIKVGDNPSGIEHVKITPLNSMSEYNRETSPSVVIYITGDVYGIEDLYGKLERAGLKLGRRMR